jgi:hypothetical protein
VEPGFHTLAHWDKFFVHNHRDVKESYDHALDIAFYLSDLFGLVLCLRVVTLNPAVITSDYSGKEVFIIRGELMKFNADINTLCFW